MKKLHSFWLLLPVVLLSLAATCGVENGSVDSVEGPVWPREYTLETGERLIASEPDITSWVQGGRLEADMEVELFPQGADEVAPGTLSIEADAREDAETGWIHLTAIEIMAYHFPTLTYEEFLPLHAKLIELVPEEGMELSPVVVGDGDG